MVFARVGRGKVGSTTYPSHLVCCNIVSGEAQPDGFLGSIGRLYNNHAMEARTDSHFEAIVAGRVYTNRAEQVTGRKSDLRPQPSRFSAMATFLADWIVFEVVGAAGYGAPPPGRSNRNLRSALALPRQIRHIIFVSYLCIRKSRIK